MKLKALSASAPVPWILTLHSGKRFEIQARSVFADGTMVTFTSLDPSLLAGAVHTGKVDAHTVAQFDQDTVLCYYKSGTVKPATGRTSTPTKRRAKK